MTKKVKNEYIGKYITVYLNGREVSFTITEETANEAEFWIQKGLDNIFEEVVTKGKYKGVENESNEA
jgi:predicted nucleotidyltransferase